jgi:hypothetical protein
MPEPISPVHSLPPPIPPPGEQAASHRDASVEQLYERVLDSIDAASGAEAISGLLRTPRDSELRLLLDAFRANGGGGVYAVLESRPDLRASVGRLSPERLESALGALEPSAASRSFRHPLSPPAAQITADVCEYFDGLVHGLTSAEGQATVRHALEALESLASNLPSELDALRRAEPRSREAALASMLGIRGDAGDLPRAMERIANVRENLEVFASRLPDHTWTQSDFPAATQRALASLGLAEAPEGSIAARTGGESPGYLDEAVSGALNAVHLGLGVMEGRHLLHLYARGAAMSTAMSAAPAIGGAVAVIGAGLVIEAYIHHLNEESHAEFVATGRLLGM